MWLLNVDTRKLEAFEGKNVPKYAILSHRWEEEEVSFKDVMKRSPESMKGYDKIDMCCKLAKQEGLQYVWVDTCCIDKRSSAELSEAINSMYRWYQKAEVCYAYLSDAKYIFDGTVEKIESKWFTRGWTLQELLAPVHMLFFGPEWTRLGARGDLKSCISDRTGIPQEALTCFVPQHYSIAEKMSWASDRETTREEDCAYSLLGIFNVNMPLLYGEGPKAFLRLQEEIAKVSTDPSIFVWKGQSSPLSGMFADSVSCFHTDRSEPTLLNKSHERLGRFDEFRWGYTVTNSGVSLKVYLECILPDVFVGYLERKPLPLLELEQMHLAWVVWAAGIFLRRLGSENEYERIILDQKTYTFKPYEAVWHDAAITRISVSRKAAYAMSTDPNYGFDCELDMHSQPHCRAFLNVYSASNHYRIVGFHGSILIGLSGLAYKILLTLGLDASCNPICVVHTVPHSYILDASCFEGLQMVSFERSASPLMAVFERVMLAGKVVATDSRTPRLALSRGNRYIEFDDIGWYQCFHVLANKPVHIGFRKISQGYDVQIYLEHTSCLNSTGPEFPACILPAPEMPMMADISMYQDYLEKTLSASLSSSERWRWVRPGTFLSTL